MATSSTLKIEPVTSAEAESFDVRHARVFAGAAARIHADIAEMRRRGLIDAEGNPTSDELPDDMKPGALRDFGG
jgi:hypothetical protein